MHASHVSIYCPVGNYVTGTELYQPIDQGTQQNFVRSLVSEINANVSVTESLTLVVASHGLVRWLVVYEQYPNYTGEQHSGTEVQSCLVLGVNSTARDTMFCRVLSG